jgi:ankyrin repeat protein
METYTNSHLHMLLQGILSNNAELILEGTRLIDRQLEEEASKEVLEIHEDVSDASEHHKLICRILAHDNKLASIPGGSDRSLPLHLAVRIGSLSLCKEIYKAYPDAVKTPNSKGKLALHHAARFGNVMVTEFLLSAYPQGASFPSCKQKIPLHFSAAFGHSTVSRMLLQANPAGAKKPSNKGKLPLHHAAKWGRISVVKLLLHVHPDGARFLDWENSLPLHDASLENQEATSLILMRSFPQALQQCNIRGEIPLFSAIRNNNANLSFAMLQVYPDGGKLVLQNLTENDGINYLHWRILELCLRGATGNISSVYPKRYGIDLPHLALSRKRQGVTEAEQSMLISMNKSIHPMSLRYLNSQGLHSNPFFARVLLLDAPNDQQNYINVEPNELHNAIPSSTGDTVDSADATTAPESSNVTKRPRIALDTTDTNRQNSTNIHHDNQQSSTQTHVFTTFLPLHSAIRLNSSLPVLRKALENCSDQLGVQDCLGCLPLHLATFLSNNGNNVDIIDDLIRDFPLGCSARDSSNRLPLHFALQRDADFTKVIKPLIETNRPAAFDEQCLTWDKFGRFKPLVMATYFDCNINTIYSLLRGDPASLTEIISFLMLVIEV